jgi:hypothetical protein
MLRGHLLLDGNPVSEARGAEFGTDGVSRFDRSGMLDWSPARRGAATC